jgi:phage baseplate assembly protein W
MLNRKTRINPIDLNPNIAVGISIPFNGTPVFNSTYTTKEQIKSNLINFFLTNRGERLFNPNFGANIRKFLFEQIDDVPLGELNELISNSLDIYFPTIIVNELKLIPDTNNNTLYISLSYSINETNIKDKILLSFEK